MRPECEECSIELHQYDDGQGNRGWLCDNCGFSWSDDEFPTGEPPKTQRVYENKSIQKWCGLAFYNPLYDPNLGISLRTATAFNVTFASTIAEKYISQRTDVSRSPKCLPVFNHKTFNDFWANVPLNCDVVGVELSDKSQNIEDFSWPKRTLILFGSEKEGIPPKELKRCRHKVKLNTKLSINLSSMVAITLYDRFVKDKNGH